MASKETEQIHEEQKLAEVKKELALLKAAIKKQEQTALQQEKSADTVETATELFVKQRKVSKDILVAKQRNKDKEGTSEQQHTVLDVSPGDHTVVEL